MTTVSSGQVQYVGSGQTISGTLILSGCEQYIYAGGEATYTDNLAGGYIVNLGVVYSMYNAGYDYVESGATTEYGTVASGGTEYVFSGGLSYAQTIIGYAAQYVYGGGL